MEESVGWKLPLSFHRSSSQSNPIKARKPFSLPRFLRRRDPQAYRIGSVASSPFIKVWAYRHNNDQFSVRTPNPRTSLPPLCAVINVVAFRTRIGLWAKPFLNLGLAAYQRVSPGLLSFCKRSNVSRRPISVARPGRQRLYVVSIPFANTLSVIPDISGTGYCGLFMALGVCRSRELKGICINISREATTRIFRLFRLRELFNEFRHDSVGHGRFKTQKFWSARRFSESLFLVFSPNS